MNVGFHFIFSEDNYKEWRRLNERKIKVNSKKRIKWSGIIFGPSKNEKIKRLLSSYSNFFPNEDKQVSFSFIINL